MYTMYSQNALKAVTINNRMNVYFFSVKQWDMYTQKRKDTSTTKN